MSTGNTRFGYAMAMALLRAGRDVKRDAWNGQSKHLERLPPGQSQVKQNTSGSSASFSPTPADLNSQDWHVRTSEDL